MKKTSLSLGDSIVIDSVELATNFFQRSKGLIGRRSLSPNRAIHISHCGNIHTFFMAFCIDVYFLNKDNVIVNIASGIKPFKFAFGGLNAKSVIEVESGWLPHGTINVGDKVSFAHSSY